MRCKRVGRLLSPYIDDVLDPVSASRISEHLERCLGCRRERRRLENLRRLLTTIEPDLAPDYLKDLVDRRLASARHDNWRRSLREAVEYRWSKIRTTDTSWYLIRILGTAATFVFFFVISEAMRPIYFDLQTPPNGRDSISQEYTYQFRTSLLRNLGYATIDPLKMPLHRTEPQLNHFALVTFGQSASRDAADDSFSVVTEVDRSGAAKISNVIEYPSDARLLNEFDAMLRSARCRPASRNGRTVDSRVVLTFSKIAVYD